MFNIKQIKNIDRENENGFANNTFTLGVWTIKPLLNESLSLKPWKRNVAFLDQLLSFNISSMWLVGPNTWRQYVR